MSAPIQDPRPRRPRPAGGWIARLTRIAPAAAVLLSLMGALARPEVALAHERRTVGPYTFVVGFLTEPAISGQPNGVDLRITRTDTNEPVTGAERTLKVAVAFGGGQPKEFPLRARFGQPGAYAADLIPTKPGSYIFTFTGTVDGTPVNERFESGPGRFNDVEAAEKLQFPEAFPAPAEMSASLREAAARAAAAEARAAQAQALGLAGAALGLAGLAVGAFALSRGRRAAQVAPSVPAGLSPAGR